MDIRFAFKNEITQAQQKMLCLAYLEAYYFDSLGAERVIDNVMILGLCDME